MMRLAVIMSVYWGDIRHNVHLAIDSILSQTIKDFDLYVICDGIIDNELFQDLKLIKDSRFILLSRVENKGLAFSLNELLKIVFDKGYQFIARMDADDISKKDRFERQLKFLYNHPTVDVVGGAINEIDENGINKGKVVKYPLNHQDCVRFFKKRNPLAHPTVMFRRSFFEKTKGFYSTQYIRNEDTYLWYEGFKSNAIFANLGEVVLDFRVTNSFFKQRRSGNTFAKSQLSLRRVINEGLDYGIDAKIYAILMYIIMISPSWVLKIAYKILR